MARLYILWMKKEAETTCCQIESKSTCVRIKSASNKESIILDKVKKLPIETNQQCANQKTMLTTTAASN